MKSNKNIGVIQLKDAFSSKDICYKKINNFFSIRNKKTPYICTTQAAIWRKDFLLRNLRKGESPWDFEIIGSYRLRKTHKIVLYRNDAYHDTILYPKGGVVWGGKIVKGFDAFKDYPFFERLINYNFSQQNSDSKHSKKFFLFKLFNKIASFLYPFISIIFPFVKRFGHAYPKYVFKLLNYKK